MTNDQAREFYSLQRERDALIMHWERLEHADNFEHDKDLSQALRNKCDEISGKEKQLTQQMIATIKGSK